VSRSLGASLPPALQARLSQADLPRLLGRGVPLVTLDAAGRPHPMLLSYLEILARSATVIRVAVGTGSNTARNLETRGAATLLIAEPEATVYVKCRAAGAPLVSGDLARFELAVEEVLEDSAAEGEGGARITGGVTYAPVPALDGDRGRATLALLRAE
jgi:flavin reductase (DIM6/NTAB) family NADH-FMN oxidoreductase RutF